MPKWRNGRRARFRSVWGFPCGGSTPLFGTTDTMLWTNDLAYLVGLMATDGNLSNDGRHLIFVSKDLEQVQNVSKLLKLTSKIQFKKSGFTGRTDSFVLQFSDVKLYRFLTTIGLHPNKSKTLQSMLVPDEFFADFVRGCLDGDGHTYSYWDKRWRSSFMFYTGFTSASMDFLIWLNERIHFLFGIEGKIRSSGMSAFQLVFAKRASLCLMKKVYYDDRITCLSRKKIKVEEALDIISQQAGMLKW